MTPARRLASALFATSLIVAACGGARQEPQPPPPLPPLPPPAAALPSGPPPPTAQEADQFLAQVNAELKQLWTSESRASWIKATYITHDSELLEAQAREEGMEYLSRKIKEARRYESIPVSHDAARQLYLLKYSAGLPAPSDPAARARLAKISTELESMYGKGEYCSPKLKGHGNDKQSECLALGELEKILANKRDYELLLEAWRGWRTISPPMRPIYAEFVSLGNKGARELGFSDVGAIWKGRYDLPQAQFEAEMARLWEQVKPLYQELHCYVRKELKKRYGADRFAADGTIPAHLLGNMWSQDWANIYPLVEPHKGKGEPDLTRRLVAKKYQPVQLVQLAEKFFVSLGMDPLPKSFWERSLFTKPKDRDVVCHASAWDVDYSGDLRIKMCIEVRHEDLVTIHHELGHNYYFHYYNKLPVLYQGGANDGFHEGIGDTLALSVTPEYLQQIGVIDKVVSDPQADLNVLMQRALEGIAFLPFGKLIDEWRWDVFSGKTSPDDYNKSWWELRRRYQGIAAPIARSENDFDPGAKFHIPANVPYTRYFIARILQYQFHRALCKAAGHTGPLYKCSIYGNKAAGDRMIAMLELGQSRPWPEALEVISGEKAMDASAIIDYYSPLVAWLKDRNAGEQCGWTP
jgi:peptidyl-dipeptidase A